MVSKSLVYIVLIALWGGVVLSSSLLAAETAVTVYKDLCAGCHGVKGKGDGPAAVALNPRPQDFCKSEKHPTDADTYKMIAEGGASMGDSTDIQQCGRVFHKQAILDLVAYTHTLCKK